MAPMVPLQIFKHARPLTALCALYFSSEISAVEAAESTADGVRRGTMRELDESPALRFVALADWGADLNSTEQRSGQQSVADGIASWLENVANEDREVRGESAPFVLSLGDHFYPWGVEDADDMAERFARSFEEVYDHDAFDGVPWYAIAGNHDYKGNVTAQMNYSSSRWIFPDYFHGIVREVRIPGNDAGRDTLKVEILAIDTLQLACHNGTSHEIRTRGWSWIEGRLQHSDADYLIIAGHYPIRHVPILEELMWKHEVSAYVAGHDHCHKYDSRDGVHHFTSGTGMEINDAHWCDRDTIEGEGLRGGFLSFEARVDKMVVQHHDQNGNILHSTEVKPRHVNGRRSEVSVESS